MKRNTRGFTLIELLVVIAIIGILASVVLVSLQSARKKGNDSRIISDVQQMRVEAESKFDGTKYDAAFSINSGATATFTNGSGIKQDATANPAALKLVTDASDNKGILFVVTNAGTSVDQYAVYGALPSSANVNYFCIDSTGATAQSITDHDDTSCTTN